MVRDKYAVRLAQEQREELQRLVRVGKNSARVTARGRILLKSGGGWAAPRVAEALDVALSTVYRVKQRFAEEGLEKVLQDRRRVGEGFAGPSPGQPAPEVGRPGRSPPDCPPVVAGGRLWPAARRRKGMTTGPCVCWPGRWSSWGWRPPCPMRESESVSKKHSQAVAEEGVVHSQGERGICG